MINANEKRLKTLQKELAKEYSKSEKEIRRIMSKYMKAFQEADAIEISRLQKGEITFAQYQKWRREKLQTSEWSRRLTRDISEELTERDKKALDITNKALAFAAAEGIAFALFEVSRVIGNNGIIQKEAKRINMTSRSQKEAKRINMTSRSAIEQALKGKLYKKKLNVAKDMLWNEKNVRNAIVQSLMKGEGVPKAAERLLDTVGSYYQREDIKDWVEKTEKEISKEIARKNRIASQRDARTMLNAAEQGGKLAEYEELAEEGVDIEKGWMATLDERTRDSHAEMDMEFVGVDDEFSNGLEYPCDPAGAPEEVYNCRCTLISKIDGKTIAFEERRNNLERPYEEWKSRSQVT